MEHRVILPKLNILSFLNNISITDVHYVKDLYTGKKRIRTDLKGTRSRIYKTPVNGIIYRISILCVYKGIKNIWFEYKWTSTIWRFEVEFEGEVPKEFINYKNIPGWDILNVK